MGLSTVDMEKLRSMQEAVFARLQKYLADETKLSDKEKKRFNRTIWRVGELNIEQAVPLLVARAKSDPSPGLTAYNIAWSLGRIGDPVGIEAIDALESAAGGKHIFVHSICREARYWMSTPEQQQETLSRIRTELPDILKDAVLDTDAEAFLEVLSNYLQSVPNKEDYSQWSWREDRYEEYIEKPDNTVISTKDLVVETLYLLSLQYPHVREALLKWVAGNDRLRKQAQTRAFKLLWKLSEFRCDGEMFAQVVRRLHTMRTYDYEIPGSKLYLRQRSWRTLNRLGEIGDARYVDMAENLLLSMSDEDGKEPEKIRSEQWRWNLQTREYTTIVREVTYAEYSSFLAFGHILYKRSSRYNLAGHKWVIKNEDTSEGRTEAFPELWDQVPERVFGLLAKSECKPVHTFAANILKDHPDFLKVVPVEDWFQLLESKYKDTAVLALEALKQVYADKEPDARLIRACLTSQIDVVRDAGKEWLKRASYILQDSLDLLVWMILSDHEDLRLLSRDYVYMFDGQEDKQQEIFEQLIGGTLGQGADVDAAIIENAGWVLVTAFRSQLSIITFEAIELFIDHGSPHIQILGTQILSAQNLKPHEIPPELYGRLFNSSVPEIRAEAVSLMKNLRPEELAQWDEMLGNLMLSEHAQVRQSARELIGIAIGADRAFAEKLLQKFLSVLFKSETSDGLHDDLFELFNAELKPSWNTIDKNQLWRMLTAKSKGIQRVASVMLQQRPDSDYSVRQWATLGNNPSLNVRAWAWRAFDANVEMVKENVEAALPILNSDWEDSRSFGFNYFSKHFPFDQWSEEQVISLCDSKHQEVQELGRNLVTEHIKVDRGPKYLLALSEHPSISMQKFLGQFLVALADGQVDKVLELEQYFVSVLMRVNKGRTAKDQVLEFIYAEALKDRKVAEMVARIMQSLSLSAAIYDKAKSLEIMLELAGRYPGLAMPVKVREVEVRGYQEATQ